VTTQSYEQVISNVPSAEIARHLARIARVEFALDEQMIVSERELPTSHEELAIDGLRQALNLKSVEAEAAACAASMNVPVAPPFGGLLMLLGKPVRQTYSPRATAFDRIGLIELSQPNPRLRIPLGARAALHYRRADINSPIDRALHTRSEEIDAASAYLLEVEPHRVVSVKVRTANAAKTAMEKTRQYWSMYAAAETTDAWWRELSYDLGRIDAASTQLSGNS